GAARANWVQDWGCVITATVLPNRPRHGEEHGPVRQLIELRADDVRLEKRGVHVPEWTETAEPGEAKPGRAELLRDVSGDVDPDHVEGNPACAGAIQGREPVADLLEIGAEAVLEEIRVVALVFSRAEEGLVWHEERGREVVGEGDPAHGARLRGCELRIGRDPVEGVGACEKR